MRIIVRLAVPYRSHLPFAFCFRDVLAGPTAAYHVLSRLARAAQEIHRHHRELQAGASLQENDAVAAWNIEQLLQKALGLFQYAVEGLRAMADLQYRYPQTVQVDDC